MERPSRCSSRMSRSETYTLTSGSCNPYKLKQLLLWSGKKLGVGMARKLITAVLRERCNSAHNCQIGAVAPPPYTPAVPGYLLHAHAMTTAFSVGNSFLNCTLAFGILGALAMISIFYHRVGAGGYMSKIHMRFSVHLVRTYPWHSKLIMLFGIGCLLCS